MIAYLKAHLTKAEFISIFQTFIATAGVDAIFEWHTVLSGDLSKTAIIALLTALGKSLLKAIWIAVENGGRPVITTVTPVGPAV